MSGLPSTPWPKRPGNPLYLIRRRLLASHDRLDPAGYARTLTWLHAGDPEGEAGAAYLAKELFSA